MPKSRRHQTLVSAGAVAGILLAAPSDALPSPKASAARMESRVAIAVNDAKTSNDAKTPKDAYDRHVGCASIAAAAVDRTKMLSSGSEKDKANAAEVLTITRDKAMTSGKDLGITSDDVTKAIARGKDGILKKIEQAQGPAAEKEKADLGRVLIACAIVEKLGR